MELTTTDTGPAQYYFADHQKRFLMDEVSRRLLLSGSVGAGKTYIGCVKAYKKGLQYPGSRILIARKDYTSLEDSTLHTLLEGDPEVGPVIPEENIISHNKSKHRIKFYSSKPGMPSEIIYTGLNKGAGDKYPLKIGSTQFSDIFIDEQIEIDKGDFQFLESRLRHPLIDKQGNRGVSQIFGTTNPAGPNHWMHDMFIDEESRSPNTNVIYARTEDNPFLDPDYIDRLRETYTGMMRDRLLLGKWVAAEGRVYDNFDRDVHVKDAGFFEDREYKKVIVGSDAGYTNPRALIIMGITGADNIHLLREYYRTRREISDAIDWLKNIPDDRITKKTIDQLLHDPSEPAEIEEMKAAGIPAEKANNDVVSGISAVNERIGNYWTCERCSETFYTEKGVGQHTEESHGTDDVKARYVEPRIFVHPACKNFLNEIVSYQYADDNRRNDEKPVKENDHLMDATRYGIMGLKDPTPDFAFTFA